MVVAEPSTRMPDEVLFSTVLPMMDVAVPPAEVIQMPVELLYAGVCRLYLSVMVADPPPESNFPTPM